ncbi:MAG TPA: hypothetical protein VE397_15110 [Stellaceae bacterium]|jgi:hypothetical protein|nr:hypothetical protein [Stellaceae bacterium]
MRIATAVRLMKPLALSAVLSLALTALGQADVPGYDFMMFPDRMALVVSPSAIDSAGKAPKAVISEKAAAALTAGAVPLSRTMIVLLYQGKVYIVPDKKMASGKMASDMVETMAEHGK